jgi:hypothetical protein
VVDTTMDGLAWVRKQVERADTTSGPVLRRHHASRPSVSNGEIVSLRSTLGRARILGPKHSIHFGADGSRRRLAPENGRGA